MSLGLGLAVPQGESPGLAQRGSPGRPAPSRSCPQRLLSQPRLAISPHTRVTVAPRFRTSPPGRVSCGPREDPSTGQEDLLPEGHASFENRWTGTRGVQGVATLHCGRAVPVARLLCRGGFWDRQPSGRLCPGRVLLRNPSAVHPGPAAPACPPWPWRRRPLRALPSRNLQVCG